MFEDLVNKLGGRKFFLVTLIFICSTILLIVSKIVQNDYMTLIQLIILGYAAGNISQSYFVKKENVDTIKIDETAKVEETDVTTTDTKSRGRKFNLMVVIYLVSVGLTYYSYLSSDIYLKIVGWLFSIYIAGNVASKVVDSKHP